MLQVCPNGSHSQLTPARSVPLTKALDAGPEHTGFLLGMSESAQALAGVASPAFAGFLYEAYGSSAPCLAASMCCVLAAIVFATLVPNHTKSDDTRICNEKHKVKAA